MRTLTTNLIVLILLTIPGFMSAQYIVKYPAQNNSEITEISCVDVDLNCENGFVLWEDGRNYEGAIKNGKPNGEGKMSWTNDVYYEGTFKNGNRHGYGKMVNKKTTYDGEWLSLIHI